MSKKRSGVFEFNKSEGIRVNGVLLLLLLLFEFEKQERRKEQGRTIGSVSTRNILCDKGVGLGERAVIVV